MPHRSIVVLVVIGYINTAPQCQMLDCNITESMSVDKSEGFEGYTPTEAD